MRKRTSIYNLLMVFALLFLIPSCAVNPVTGKRQLMLMSEEQEIKMGEQYDPQVIRTFGLYEDEDLMQFIREEGVKMGKLSHRPDLEYHFRILDTPVINAFAVPGGYIYFTRGILAQFNNEAELMGVLGHEMGHITARHSVSQQSKQQLGQLLIVGGMIASEEFRDFAGYALQGMQLLFLKFSRDHERQSDQLGVEYASRMKYDAGEMANFFQVLDRMQMESGHAGVPTFLSTHPNPANRYENVKQLAVQWQDSLGYADWEVDEEHYLQMIDGMVYGEDPRQGYVEGNVFYHPGMQFKFPVPSGWKLENSPLQVQMVPEDGQAMILFTLSDNTNLREAAETTMKDLNLTLLDSKETTVNGFPAYATVSEQTTQNQGSTGEQKIKVMSYFIKYDQTIYVFHGVAGESGFNERFRTFESTMINFDQLDDPARLNVQPKRIKVVPVKRASSLANVLEDYNVPEDRREELALLNNMNLSDQLVAGKRIKIISN